MSLTLSEFLAREFGVDNVNSLMLRIGTRDSVGFPQGRYSYFHLLLAGQGTIRVDGENPVTLQAGDFALMLYGTPHTLSPRRVKHIPVTQMVDDWNATDEPKEITVCGKAPPVMCALSGELQLTRTPRSGPIYRALPHVLHYRRAPDDDIDGTVLVARMAHIERGCRGPGASLFVQALVQLHLVQTLRQVHDEVTEFSPIRLGAPHMGQMAAILRKIRQHPEKPWTVSSLAQEMGSSRSSFAAKFRAYTGLGPIQFVTRTRLTEALLLLRNNPDLPVYQVARRVGYEAQSSFTRAFKAQFGLAPREYATRLLKIADPHPKAQEILAPVPPHHVGSDFSITEGKNHVVDG